MKKAIKNNICSMVLILFYIYFCLYILEKKIKDIYLRCYQLLLSDN